MITVIEAKNIVLKSTPNFEVEEIPFAHSNGRILKETIVADRDFPPFNRVSMDGIAIDFNEFKEGQREFKIEGIQPAGSSQISLNENKNCIEVMTGAVLPNNTNTVIPYEDVFIENGIAKILVDEISLNQNVHFKGKDRKKGAVLIPQNRKISSAEIGVMATVGKVTVKVGKQPKVMIISTGDELVAVDENPKPYQIRRSNVFTLESLLARLKIDSDIDHINDNKSILKQKIANYLLKYDVLLFSGAVSKGKFDFLPKVFIELGVKKLFHHVTQRPGKPFFYGKSEKCTIFGFPGNPVSTFVNCLVYFYPWFYQRSGVKIQEETAILTEEVEFKPNLTYFLQVKLSDKYGHLLATPILANGSGDLASLVDADAFIELPKEQKTFKKGENYSVIRFR